MNWAIAIRRRAKAEAVDRWARVICPIRK